MAMQPDIQYVPFCYVDGTAARKVQRQPAKKASATPAPKRRQAKRKVIAVDPVAIGGIVVAVVMLVMLLAGFAEYTAMQEKNLQMQNYLTSLQLENAQLQQNFESNIDMEYVQDVADALGMVPAGEANQIQIQVQLPAHETQQLTLWETFTTFLAGLFA
jgi:uncharacterized protein HemX